MSIIVGAFYLSLVVTPDMFWVADPNSLSSLDSVDIPDLLILVVFTAGLAQTLIGYHSAVKKEVA